MAGLSQIAADAESGVRSIKISKDASISVRGLALYDISNLIRLRSAEIEAFFNRYMSEASHAHENGDPKYAKTAATKLSGDLLISAPDLAADIIAFASDEPQLAYAARRLPFPIQIEALEAISELTFIEEDSLKKALTVIIKFMGATTNLMSDINASKIGSILSENGSAL
jgi:hypothetical protein